MRPIRDRMHMDCMPETGCVVKDHVNCPWTTFDAVPQPCISCHHTESHTGGGIAVCLHYGCGCNGPVTIEDVAIRAEAAAGRADQYARRAASWDDWAPKAKPIVRFDGWGTPLLVIMCILAVATGFLFFMDSITNHEPPTLTCEDPQVLVIHDNNRTAECMTPETP